jgi:hypothetical protein
VGVGTGKDRGGPDLTFGTLSKTMLLRNDGAEIQEPTAG